MAAKPLKPKAQAQTIVVDRLATPIGPMLVSVTRRGLCLLEFADRKKLPKELQDLQHYFHAQLVDGENAMTCKVKQQVEEYFASTRKVFDLALDAPGTEFQKSVWEMLQTVSYGQTAFYQQLAEKLGKPLAIRAVAAANGVNRISIVIPCHRIIGKDGSLTGYGGGLQRKRWLLEFEQQHLSSQKKLFL